MSKAVALCYLHKQGDEKNKCQLFDDRLEVIYKGKVNPFLLAHQVLITFDKKLMILPLVFGGAAASFLTIAIFLNRINPWIGLSLLFMSILIIYVGVEGKHVMVVTWGKTSQVFPLKTITPNLSAFVSFFHDFEKEQYNRHEPLKLYHIADLKSWRAQTNHTTYIHMSLQNEGYIHASTRNQIISTFERYYAKRQGEYVLLEIDPLLVQSTVKYEESPNNHKFYPHIYGPIQKEAITSASTFRTVGELHQVLN